MQSGKIRTIVLGIFLHEGRLLVFEGGDPATGRIFYRPLGGGIEFGEQSHQAFVRESREELGAEVTHARYLGMLENIFTLDGRMGHEMVLLYEAEFADPALYVREAFPLANDNGEPIKVLWKPLADFETGALLVPSGLLELIRNGRTA
ncbi:MAG: NUDIX domain-containing protein [Chloroflexi bacterium]|nr:NUDIX domain-containing protein [Chloroflexota bacterium]